MGSYAKCVSRSCLLNYLGKVSPQLPDKKTDSEPKANPNRTRCFIAENTLYSGLSRVALVQTPMSLYLRWCLLIVLFIITPGLLQGQETYYEREWIGLAGDSRVERSNAITVDDAGYSYVTGHIQLQDDEPSRLVYLMKMDPTGQKVWDRSFNFGFGSEGRHLLIDNDLIVVVSDIKVDGVFNSVLSKHRLDDGMLISSTPLQISRSANVVDFVKRPGGGYYMTGRLNHSSDTDYHAFIAKTDVDGNVIWMKDVGQEGLTIAREIHFDADENLYIVGLTSENLFGIQNPGRFSMFVAKFDSEGEQLWGQLFGGAFNNMGYSLSLTPGGYLIVGGSGNGRFDQPDVYTNRVMYVIRLLQETGEIDRTTYYNPGGDIYLWKLISTGDDSFIFTGWTNGSFYNTIHFSGDVAIFGEARNWKLIPQSFQHIQSRYSYSLSMHRTENGDVYWGGYTFEGFFDLPLFGSSFDIFVAKLTTKEVSEELIHPWEIESLGEQLLSSTSAQIAFVIILIAGFLYKWSNRKSTPAIIEKRVYVMLMWQDSRLFGLHGQKNRIEFDGREKKLAELLYHALESDNVVLNDDVDAILLPNHPSPDYVRKIRNVTLDKLESRLQTLCPLPEGASYIIRTVYATDRRKSEYQFNPEYVRLAESVSRSSATA